nr:protein-tyrosine phosphatase family protein [uncultured Methanospirillum sp.]
MFRRVPLPDTIPGRLFLTAMPGRYEPITEFEARMSRLSISHVVCLTPLDEVITRSPGYYASITAGEHQWQFNHLPIPDFGVPEDRNAFLELIRTMVGVIVSGDAILVHCGAGIGRTGTFAMVLTMALGLNRLEGAASVRMADAEPEGMLQQALIDWCECELQKKSEIGTV